MKLSILGPLRVTAADRTIPITSGRQRSVLAVLALRANQVVTPPQLVDAVWGNDAPVSAQGLVQTYVWRLRQHLSARSPAQGDSRIVSHAHGYLLRLYPGELDAQIFEQLLSEGEKALGAGDAALASGRFAEALALWSADPVADTHLEGAAIVEIERLCELRRRMLELQIEAHLQLGQHSCAIAELQALIALDPMNEHLNAQLMLALSRSGRRVEAIQAYAATRQLLVDELGVEPGTPIRELHQAILRGDKHIQPPPEATAGAHGAPARAQDVQASEPAAAGRGVPRQLPGAVRHFVGRAKELQTLTRLIEVDRSAAGKGAAVILVISGAAGVGKTTLAVYWGHQVAHRFPDGQMHLNLRGFDRSARPLTPAEAIRELLDALEVPAERIPASLDAQVGLYRSLLAGKRMLVLLDNACSADQVRPLLFGTSGSTIVVTSRNRLTGLVASEGAVSVTLDLLTDAEARELVTRQIGPHHAASAPQEIDAITELCARLPLALSIAAARAVTSPDLQLAGLTAQLRDSRPLDALDTGDTVTSVRAVFSWSYRNLTTAAAWLFRAIGLHFGPDISVPAAASLAGLSVDHTRAALNELTRTHLLTEHRLGRYSLHDLLRAYAADQAQCTDSADERRAAVSRVLDHYLHSGHAAVLAWDRPALDPPALGPPAPGVIPQSSQGADEALAWFRAEHAVLLAAIDHAANNGFDVHTWQLAWVLSRFLEWQGHWHDFEATQQAALAAARRQASQAEQARAYLCLGRARTRLGSCHDARSYYQQALDLYGRSGNQAGQAMTHLNLGLMWDQQGCHRVALSHAQRSLDLYQALGHRNGQANAHNDIGCLQAQLGNYQEALISCRRALTLSREGGDFFCEACAWDSLGYVQHNLGQHHKAITCYQRALDLFRKLGDRFNETAVLDHLGDAHDALGDSRLARDAWRRALNGLQALNPPAADKIVVKLSGLAERRSRPPGAISRAISP